MNFSVIRYSFFDFGRERTVKHHPLASKLFQGKPDLENLAGRKKTSQTDRVPPYSLFDRSCGNFIGRAL